MHLNFDDPQEALEYIEVNTKRKEYPFIYKTTNKFDMQELKQIQQEASRFKSYKCSVGQHSYVIGNYSLE